MNTESTENTPLIKAIEEKLVSIDSELSTASAVKAAECLSWKIDRQIEQLAKTRTEFQQMLTIEKQRSVFETEGPKDNSVFN